MVSGEQLDHAMTVGIANGIRRIDNDRARLLRGSKPIEDCTALAHREYVGEMGVELGVGVNKRPEAARLQGLGNGFKIARSSSMRPGECATRCKCPSRSV